MDSKDKIKTSYTNTVTILSVFSIAISFITIALFFFKVKENSVIDSGTYISIMATFIGICAAFIIGFQILNALSVDSKISRLNQITDDINVDVITIKAVLLKVEKDTLKVEGLTYFLAAQAEVATNKYPEALASLINAIGLFVHAEYYKIKDNTLQNIDLLVPHLTEDPNKEKIKKLRHLFKRNYDIIIASKSADIFEPNLTDVYTRFIEKTEEIYPELRGT